MPSNNNGADKHFTPFARRNYHDVGLRVHPNGGTTTLLRERRHHGLHGALTKEGRGHIDEVKSWPMVRWDRAPVELLVQVKAEDLRVQAAVLLAMSRITRDIGHDIFLPPGAWNEDRLDADIVVDTFQREIIVDWDEFDDDDDKSFGALREDTMGFCRHRFDRATGAMHQAIIGVAEDLPFGRRRDLGAETMVDILSHEIVHGLGIGHNHGTPAQLMDGGGHSGQKRLQRLERIWVCDALGLTWEGPRR